MTTLPARRVELTPDDLEQFIQLKALGHSTRKIADFYKVSHTTVWNYLRQADVQERLSIYQQAQREAIKQIALERTPRAVKLAFDVLEEAATQDKDPKGVDAAARAIMNLEKVSASVSGENKKVEVTGADGAPIQLDVRALIAQVISRA